MTTIKIMMLIAVFGHLLCGICDCLLIYTPSGKIGFQMIGGAGNWAGAIMFLGLLFLI